MINFGGGGRLQTWGGIRTYGIDQVNTSQVSKGSESYKYLTLAWRQRHSIERGHLTTARDTIGGGRSGQVGKVRSTPEKIRSVGTMGRGSLGTGPEQGCN